MSPLRSKVLVVEDEVGTASLLSEYLDTYGYEALLAYNGEDAIRLAGQNRLSAVLLDLNLPRIDGIEVCRRLRRFSSVPIIMLTARIDEADRIMGLADGADDYVSKPFSPREVMARVAAAIRRAEGSVLAGDQGPAWRVDAASSLIALGTVELDLTPVEHRILAALIASPRRIFTRDQLLDHAHPDLRAVGDRAIDTHIKNLRRKIVEAGGRSEVIGSIYGVGYRFDPAAG